MVDTLKTSLQSDIHRQNPLRDAGMLEKVPRSDTLGDSQRASWKCNGESILSNGLQLRAWNILLVGSYSRLEL